VHAARRKDLFQFLCPVKNNPQTAAVHTAQHNEASIVGYIVIRDRDALAEDIFVSK
jgi:hypothetical protein